jgi:hypothetical protein
MNTRPEFKRIQRKADMAIGCAVAWFILAVAGIAFAWWVLYAIPHHFGIL